MLTAANECIYCGETEGPLTREHIIPYSLGGVATLRSATCLKHAALTSELERQVARVAYGVYRAQHGSPTRRPHKLGSVLARRVKLEGERFDGEKVEVEVAVGDVPPMPVWPVLPPPDILSGVDPDSEKGGSIAWLPMGGELRELRKRLGLKTLYSPVATLPLTSFQRVLAKIGHAYGYARLGPKAFDAYLPSVILRDDVSPWRFVGGFEPAKSQGAKDLDLRLDRHGDDTLVVAEISLHIFPHMPRYQAVVGRML